jgi:protein gp37
MGKNTNIEWCDSTINPTTGCQGCELWAGDVRNCYAGQLHTRRLAKAHPELYAEDFTEVRLAPGRMAEAAAWSDLRGTSRPGKPWLDGLPRTIFVGDMGDVFSAAVPFDYVRDEVFAAIESPAGQRHIWMLLTKQPQRMRVVAESLGRWPKNAWAGVSVTSQANVSRIEHLMHVPAPVRFVSAEPLLGPVKLPIGWAWECPECGDEDQHGKQPVVHQKFCGNCAGDSGRNVPITRKKRLIDLVIVGGESGAGARGCDVKWLRAVVQQCREAQTSLFVKQTGSRAYDGLWTLRGQSEPTEPHYLRLRDSKGGDPSEWPEDLCVREFPRIESVVTA